MSQRLHLVGDVMIGRSFNQLFEENPDYNIWGNTLQLFREEDFLIGNLETTLTTSQNKWPNKVFNFQLDPAYADTLLSPNFNYLNLANNHILDYRLSGLIDTLNTLDDLNISYIGAGLNLKEAIHPTIIATEPGFRLHFISAADHYEYWKAGTSYPPIKGKEGIFWFSSTEPDSFLHKIQQYTQHLPIEDVVILSLHWGANWEEFIPEEKKILARRLIQEGGVKIIHGHSPHHIEDYQRIGNGVVFYSMGDFIDDYAINPVFRNDISGIATVDLGINGEIEKIEWTSTIIKNMQVNLLS